MEKSEFANAQQEIERLREVPSRLSISRKRRDHCLAVAGYFAYYIAKKKAVRLVCHVVDHHKGYSQSYIVIYAAILTDIRLY